jgi:hypothetical protein
VGESASIKPEKTTPLTSPIGLKTSSPDSLTVWVFATFTFVFVLRAIFSAQLGLGDDEAYYWDWSRHLSLSYFDHPGMTAWLIALTTKILGSTPFAVRLPALLCNSFAGVVLFQLTRELFNARAAVIAAALYLFTPGFSLGGMMMVPDAPMAFFWMLTLWFLWRALRASESSQESANRYWLLAGAALGLGLLSKYTIFLLVPATLFLLIATPRWRPQLARRGFYGAIVVCTVLALPTLIWNASHGWPTVAFHLHDRQTGGGGANFTRWTQFWVSQAVLMSPAVFVAACAAFAMITARFKDERWRFVFLMSFPVFALFAFQALFAEFKPHWPMPSYVLMFAAIGQLLIEGFGLKSPRAVRVARRLFMFATLIFLVPINVLFYIGTIKPVIPQVARTGAAALGIPLEWDPKFDPTNDLYGWDMLAARLKTIQREEREAGRVVPFLASWRYQLVSQLGFATGDEVWRTVETRDQFMYVQPPERHRELSGQPALFITDNRFERDPMSDGRFTSCEEDRPVEIFRENEKARVFRVWRCQGYRPPA